MAGAPPDMAGFDEDVAVAVMASTSRRMNGRVLSDLEVRENVEKALRALPLLPEELAFVDSGSDIVAAVERDMRTWTMNETGAWDDPDAVDAPIRTAIGFCNFERTTKCNDAEVLAAFNDFLEDRPPLTMQQLQRRVDRVARLRIARDAAVNATPALKSAMRNEDPREARGIRWAPDVQTPDADNELYRKERRSRRHDPWVENIARGLSVTGRHVTLEPMPERKHPVMRSPVLPALNRRRTNGLPPVRAAHRNVELPPIGRQRGGDAELRPQAWLNSMDVPDLLFIRRSLNALTVVQPVTVGGKELFVKVATLGGRTDDTVRDAINSLIMSTLVDRARSWTANFIGVRPCYQVEDVRRFVDEDSDEDSDEEYSGSDDEDIPVGRAELVDGKMVYGVKQGGAYDDDEEATFGFKHGQKYTHFALFYENAPGDTVANIRGKVTSHNVLEFLQRLIIAGTFQGLTHNDLHLNNVIRDPNGGLRAIDYGRVVFKHIPEQWKTDNTLMTDMLMLQNAAAQVQHSPIKGVTSATTEKLIVSTSSGDHDVFRKVRIAPEFTWIPDFVACTLGVFGRQASGNMMHPFKDLKKQAENVCKRFQGFITMEDKVPELLEGAIDNLNKSGLSFLAPGMALYSMIQYFGSHVASKLFYGSGVMRSEGGVVVSAMCNIFRDDKHEHHTMVKSMFAIVQKALDDNALFTDCFQPAQAGGADVDEQYYWEQFTGRLQGVQGPVPLPALDDAIAGTMVENAAIVREPEEVEDYDGMMPDEYAVAVLPSAAAALAPKYRPVSQDRPAIGKEGRNQIENLENNVTFGKDSWKIGVGEVVMGGGKRGNVFANVAMSCVVLAMAVIGSMSS